MTEPAKQSNIAPLALAFVVCVAVVSWCVKESVTTIYAPKPPVVAPLLPKPLLPHGRFLALRKGMKLVVVPESSVPADVLNGKGGASFDTLSANVDALTINLLGFDVKGKGIGAVGEEGP